VNSIAYLTGDATKPLNMQGPRIIAHICNDRGGWGKGFVVALGKRFPTAREFYRHWAQAGLETFYLGAIQIVGVGDGLHVVNMVAQHGYKGTAKNAVPLDYVALQECLKKLANLALRMGASVHMPRIGTGNAGGSWLKIEPMIERTLCVNGIAVVVYDLPGSQAKGIGLHE
jgi:O-acetyl-ADP-ribose deacetylase (regulator of RNase III)